MEAVLQATWKALADQQEPPDPGKLTMWIFAEARRHADVGHRGLIELGGEATEKADLDSVEHRFAALTPKQREVLRLKFVHGFRHEEIAQIIELGSSQTARLLHNALARLRPPVRERDAGGVRGDVGEDPRVTLAALGELDGASRAAWEALQTGASMRHEQVEDVRRAAQWVAERLAHGMRPPVIHSRWQRRRRAMAVVAGVGVVFVTGFWFWPGRLPPANASSQAESRFSSLSDGERAPREAVRQEDFHSRVKTSAVRGSEDRRSLGVVRDLQRQRVSTAPGSADAPAIDEAAFARHRAEVLPLAPTDVPAAWHGAAGETTSGVVAAVGAEQPPAVDGVGIAERLRAAPIHSTEVASIVALKRALEQSRWPQLTGPDRASLQRYFARRRSATVPDGRFGATIEAAALPWSGERVAVRVAATARSDPPPVRPAATVIFLLDVSESMLPPNRLPLVQEAVAGVIERLRPDDRVGWVTYAAEVQSQLAPAVVGDPRLWRERLETLAARGATNGGAGLEAAFALARRDSGNAGPAVVVLCTDGEFNVGATSEDEIVALVQRHTAGGVRLAVIGFGRNGEIDPRLAMIALLAEGASGYVNTRADAVTVMLRQLGDLVLPVAEDVELELGAEGAGLAATRAARVLPAETVAGVTLVPREFGVTARLAFSDPRTAMRETQVLTWSGELAALRDTSADFRFDVAVARLGELLAAEFPPDDAAWAELDRWARSVADDDGGYRAELLALIARARAIRAD